MKELFYTLLYFILTVITVIFVMYSCSDSGLKKDHNELKSAVGTECIINNDTLKVINYNIWNKDLTLSNNVKVNYEYYLKNKI